MKEIIPIIGHWYKAAITSSRYIIRLDKIADFKSDNPTQHNYYSEKWRTDNMILFNNHLGGFHKLIEEIPCPEEFIEQYKIQQYEIY